MRIFFASPSTTHQNQLPASRIWHINLFLPLVDLGHDLVVFDFDYTEFNNNLDETDPRQQPFIIRNRPRLSEALLAQVRAAHREKPIDLFFSYFYAANVESETIREIGRMGITTVNWYCNASYQFNLVKGIAPAYNYCLVPEKFRLEDYRRSGATPIYCQEAANPSFYKPYDLPQEFDVTFVGQKYGNRPGHIKALLDAGVDARVWGPLWQDRTTLWDNVSNNLRRLGRGRRPVWLRDDVPPERCGPPLSDEELTKMYSRSKISLGFTTVAEIPADGTPAIKQVRLRDFEATMSGAFYLVEYFDELAEFFEPDEEIVFFHNPEELVDKARYYLGHSAERDRIRQAGLRRARAEHTWQKRFQTVFNAMGLG